MKQWFLVVVFAAALAGCSPTQALDIPAGSDVTIEKTDGVQVAGRLVEVESEQVVLQAQDGTRVQVPRSAIKTLKTTPAREQSTHGEAAASRTSAAQEERSGNGASNGNGTSPSEDVEATRPADSSTSGKDDGNPLKKMFSREPAYKEVTVPAGTVLPVELQSSVGSDTSSVEDQVRGTVRRAITVDGVQVIPAGTTVLGHVTAAQRPGKVKGRGSVGFRFNQLDLPGEGGRVSIATGTISRLAPATKKQDAAKIGGGAAGGAIIGGILGGGDGAAKGAAIGGGAGTAVVLSTRGKNIRLGPGTPLSVKLTKPMTVRVALKG